MTEQPSLTKRLDMHKEQLFKVVVCVVCWSICARMCVYVCRPEIQQFVWVGSLFWFLLFFSPFQCFPPLLCSKDKFGRFAKFITFHLRFPTPFTLPQLPPLPPSSRHLLATCADLLVLSFVPHSHSCEFVMLRVRLGSGHRAFYQPSMEPNALFIWLWHTSHTHIMFLCFVYFSLQTLS